MHLPDYENDDFNLRLEYSRDEDHYWFVHCDVHNWTPRVRRDLIRLLDILCVLAPLRVFTESRRTEKFATIVGFERLKTQVSPYDGRLKVIMTRRS